MESDWKATALKHRLIEHLVGLMKIDASIVGDARRLKEESKRFLAGNGCEVHSREFANKQLFARARRSFWKRTGQRVQRTARQRRAAAEIPNPAPGRRHNPEKLRFAAALRAAPTETEARLRHRLPIDVPDHHFRFQAVLFGYIPDFYCKALRLVIEVDGLSHVGREEYDAHRDQVLEKNGIKTVRIGAIRVLQDIDDVMRTIRLAVTDRMAALGIRQKGATS